MGARFSCNGFELDAMRCFLDYFLQLYNGVM